MSKVLSLDLRTRVIATITGGLSASGAALWRKGGERQPLAGVGARARRYEVQDAGWGPPLRSVVMAI
jgi:hypothetical protein